MKSKIKLRSIAIIVHKKRLMVHRRVPDEFWALPGGKIKFLEKSGPAIVREIKEEFGATVNNLELSIVDEHMYTFESENIHEIGFYYKCALDEYINNDEFYGIEKEKKLVFKWVTSFQFDELDYKPLHLKDRIREIAFK